MSASKLTPWRLICRSLRLDGPQTIAALAKNLKLPGEEVRACVVWFYEHGVVERLGGGSRYSLAEAHRDRGTKGRPIFGPGLRRPRNYPGRGPPRRP